MKPLLMALIITLTACQDWSQIQLADPALDGEWQGSCNMGSPASPGIRVGEGDAGDPRASGSDRVQLSVEGSRLVYQLDVYPGSDCYGRPEMEIRQEATIRTKDGGSFGEYDLDLRFDSLTLTPLTESVAESFNILAFCSISDWRALEGRDISGRQCGSETYVQGGETFFSHYRREGDLLYFDMRNKSSSESLRPLEVFSTVLHRRVQRSAR